MGDAMNWDATNHADISRVVCRLVTKRGGAR
jgi:hypothetical protein